MSLIATVNSYNLYDYFWVKLLKNTIHFLLNLLKLIFFLIKPYNSTKVILKSNRHNLICSVSVSVIYAVFLISALFKELFGYLSEHCVA